MIFPNLYFPWLAFEHLVHFGQLPNKAPDTENHGQARTPVAEWTTQNRFAAQIPMGREDISNPRSFKNIKNMTTV